MTSKRIVLLTAVLIAAYLIICLFNYRARQGEPRCLIYTGLFMDNGRIVSLHNIRRKIRDTLQVLEQYDALPGNAVGYSADPSSHLETTRWFSQNLNTTEAQVLAQHPNTFIKALAFQKLFSERDTCVYTLILSAHRNPTPVYEESGCTGNEYTLFAYYMKVIRYPLTFTYAPGLFSENQQAIIDSLVACRAMPRN